MNPPRSAAAALLALALTAAACSNGGGGDSPGPPSLVLPSPRAVNATTAPLLPTGRFTLPDFDYSRFQTLMSQLQGTPVVISLWGSWCGPCRGDAPVLAKSARRFGHRVQFIGVDVGDVRTQARVFIRDFGWSFPSVFDPARQILSGLGFEGPPITMLFDRSGKRGPFFSGPIPSQRELTRAIDKVA